MISHLNYTAKQEKEKQRETHHKNEIVFPLIHLKNVNSPSAIVCRINRASKHFQQPPTQHPIHHIVVHKQYSWRTGPFWPGELRRGVRAVALSFESDVARRGRRGTSAARSDWYW